MKATILNTVYDPAPEKVDGHKWPNVEDRPSLSMVLVSVYMHPDPSIYRAIKVTILSLGLRITYEPLKQNQDSACACA